VLAQSDAADGICGVFEGASAREFPIIPGEIKIPAIKVDSQRDDRENSQRCRRFEVSQRDCTRLALSRSAGNRILILSSLAAVYRETNKPTTALNDGNSPLLLASARDILPRFPGLVNPAGKL